MFGLSVGTGVGYWQYRMYLIARETMQVGGWGASFPRKQEHERRGWRQEVLVQ